MTARRSTRRKLSSEAPLSMSKDAVATTTILRMSNTERGAPWAGERHRGGVFEVKSSSRDSVGLRLPSFACNPSDFLTHLFDLRRIWIGTSYLCPLELTQGARDEHCPPRLRPTGALRYPALGFALTLSDSLPFGLRPCLLSCRHGRNDVQEEEHARARIEQTVSLVSGSL